jgi:hypothetical protein
VSGTGPWSGASTMASVTVRLRKIDSGMIGSLARASTRTAMASGTRPATKAAVSHYAHANFEPASAVTQRRVPPR